MSSGSNSISHVEPWELSNRDNISIQFQPLSLDEATSTTTRNDENMYFSRSSCRPILYRGNCLSLCNNARRPFHTTTGCGTSSVQGESDTTLPQSDIPGASGLAAMRNLVSMVSAAFHGRIHRRMAEMSQQYGPIYRDKFGPTQVVVLSDPDDVRDLMRQEPPYPKRMEVDAWVWYKEHRKQEKGVFFA